MSEHKCKPTVDFPVRFDLLVQQHVTIREVIEYFASMASKYQVNFTVRDSSPTATKIGPYTLRNDLNDSDMQKIIDTMAENAKKNCIPWPPSKNLLYTAGNEAYVNEDACRGDCKQCNVPASECDGGQDEESDDAETKSTTWDRALLPSKCDKCICRTCDLARKSYEKCHARGYTCDVCRETVAEPVGSAGNVCTMTKNYFPVMKRFQKAVDDALQKYHDAVPDETRNVSVMVSTGGTEGKLLVTLMIDRRAQFSLELVYRCRLNKWEYIVPNTKKIYPTFNAGTPLAAFVNDLIAFGESVTCVPYDTFLSECKYNKGINN